MCFILVLWTIQKMIKNWKINSKARWQFVTIYFLVVAFGFLIFTTKVTSQPGGNFEENLFGSILFLFLISIVLFTAIPFWILRKKTPNEIVIDKQQKKIEIRFNKKISQTNSLSDLGFSFIDDRFYSVLIIYKKYQAKRGHFVFKKSVSVVGLPVSLSWTKNKLLSIKDALIELDVEETKSKKGGGFFGYITE